MSGGHERDIIAIDEVVVPAEHYEWAFEFRLGFYTGLRGRNLRCPIHQRMLFPEERGKAWRHGQKAGAELRRRRIDALRRMGETA